MIGHELCRRSVFTPGCALWPPLQPGLDFRIASRAFFLRMEPADGIVTPMDQANLAKRCFAENIRLFAPPATHPEKYNLYNGLASLADALSALHSQILDLDRRLQLLESRG